MSFTYIFCVFVAVGISQVSSFSWASCGTAADPIKVVSLTASSDQTEVLHFTGKAKVAMNLTSPIQAKLFVKKKFFWGWTPIPCVEQFGSCIYDDICEMSPYKNETCPSEFVSNNLPCNCPIFQGQYLAKNFPVDLKVLPQWIEKGTYSIQMILTKDDKELLCLIVRLTL